MLTYSNVGRFLSIDLIRDALDWGTKAQGAAGDYISRSAWLKIAAIILLSGFLAIAAALSKRETRWGRWVEATCSTVICGIAIGVIGLICFTTSTAIGSLPQRQSYLELMTRALLPSTADALQNLTVDETKDYFRELTNTPPAVRDPRYFGAARGSDVLFFIMETGPYRVIPLDGDLSAFPALRGLMNRAFVATNHYTTYPYTSAAHFSILSGMYPWEQFRQTLRNAPDAMRTGALRSLEEEAGYKTELYEPDVPELERDALMYREVGARFQYYASAFPPSKQAVARAAAQLAEFPVNQEELKQKADPNSERGREEE